MLELTPERFIEAAWDINIGILSAEKERLRSDFIARATTLAESEGINVLYLDFSRYESIEEVLASSENDAFFEAIRSISKPTLLWFDNCDMLAPLDCSFTYHLRSILTTRVDGLVQSMFIANYDSLQLLFRNRRAAFYRSSMHITDWKRY